MDLLAINPLHKSILCILFTNYSHVNQYLYVDNFIFFIHFRCKLHHLTRNLNSHIFVLMLLKLLIYFLLIQDKLFPHLIVQIHHHILLYFNFNNLSIKFLLHFLLI